MKRRMKSSVGYEVVRGAKTISLPFFNKSMAEDFSMTVDRLNPTKRPTHVRKVEKITIAPRKSRKRLRKCM